MISESLLYFFGDGRTIGEKLFGTSEDRFLIVVIDFILSQVFLILFILALKY